MMRRRSGFTLIEVLAATLLTTAVVAGASAMFIQLSDASTRSTERTAESRHATAVIDRVAHDLEGAFLVMRPGDGSLDEAAGPDTGPWPWLFLADEQRVGDGADTLRFAVLNHVPRSNAGHSADLATVSYALESSESGGYALRRWVQPGVPSDPRRGPPADEAAGAVVAEGIASFSTRFLSEEGDWRTAWDSSAAPDLDRLPMAAEVRVALLDRDAWELDGEEIPGTEYVRTVLMPVRPVDLTPDDEEGDDGTGLDDDGGPLDEDEDLAGGPDDPGDCPFGTVGECVSRNASQLPPGVTADQALDFLNLDSGECAPGPTLSGFGVTISCQ